jgi:hypothetical protein
VSDALLDPKSGTTLFDGAREIAPDQGKVHTAARTPSGAGAEFVTLSAANPVKTHHSTGWRHGVANRQATGKRGAANLTAPVADTRRGFSKVNNTQLFGLAGVGLPLASGQASIAPLIGFGAGIVGLVVVVLALGLALNAFGGLITFIADEWRPLRAVAAPYYGPDDTWKTVMGELALTYGYAGILAGAALYAMSFGLPLGVAALVLAGIASGFPHVDRGDFPDRGHLVITIGPMLIFLGLASLAFSAVYAAPAIMIALGIGALALGSGLYAYSYRAAIKKAESK